MSKISTLPTAVDPVGTPWLRPYAKGAFGATAMSSGVRFDVRLGLPFRREPVFRSMGNEKILAWTLSVAKRKSPAVVTARPEPCWMLVGNGEADSLLSCPL